MEMFRSKDPGEGRKKKSGWAHHKVPKGTGFNAHLAGRAVWIDCHLLPLSKPCHVELIHGCTECPHCAAGHARIETQGYVPLYDFTGKPTVVVVKEYSREVVDRLKLYDPVYVSRGKEYHDPVSILPKAWSPTYVPRTPARQGHADIRDWLLTLWGDTALVELFRGSDSPVSQPTSRPKPFSTSEVIVPADGDPMLKAAWERCARESRERFVGPPLVAEALPVVPAPSTNGKHRKK